MSLKGWLIALAIARGVDAASTCQALGRGAAEVNPLIHNCAGAVAVTSTMSLLQATTLPILAREGHPKVAKWIARVSVGLEMSLVAHNYRVVVIMGGK